MLAREYCDEVKIKFKPIILSHRNITSFTAPRDIYDRHVDGIRTGSSQDVKE
jgi:hypothetical protein